MFDNFFLISKITEKHTVSTDVSRQKLETKDYLPDWLEPKKVEDKNSDYIQDRVTPTEELFRKHRSSSSDKITQGVGCNDIYILMCKNGFIF